ncbi:hypothetical protein D9Q98_003274 [Chlorella vulgaris]|uniref:Fungal lipase-type domain-containing protein n=1 Tax=Chlorella vulgaris TaxID=3077 RepID=A0A9D4TSA9_CHLVU|nr:hypothetical protein D9Q98_003274 [Chlorella vulgaris]
MAGSGGTVEPLAAAAPTPASQPPRAVTPLQTAPSLKVSPHYDSSRDIVLRHEFVGTGAAKTVIVLVYLVTSLCLALLILVVILQETRTPVHFFSSSSMYIANTSVGGVLTLASCAMLAHGLRRFYRSNRCGKRWTHRRRRMVRMAGAELGLQFINSALFLAPNVYVLAKPCSWFQGIVTWSAFVRWTTWNSCFLLYWIEACSWQPVEPGSRWYMDRGEAGNVMIMDAPFWRHWRKCWLWLAQEGVLLWLCVTTYRRLHMPNETFAELCTGSSYLCNTTTDVLVSLVLVTVAMGLYSLLYARDMARSFRYLQRLPYNENKQANYIIRISVRQRATAIAFFFLSLVVYTYVGFASCKSYVLSWLGYMPSMIVLVCTAIANGYLMTPKRPDDDGIMQVWLQEFAWTEGEEEERKKAERSSSLPPESRSSAAIDKEPMFCFETALKALYWSFLVYDHEEVPGSPYSVHDALELWGLQHCEMHWDRDPKGMDTKAIVGYSDDMVVIAFRGTASMANVKADLQVWRTSWPPGQGSELLCTAPMVHWGFHRAWTFNGFRQRILDWLQQHVRHRGTSTEAGTRLPLRVLVTGHSLGGALATLCAFDIAETYPESAVRVKCYTFGAPRTGNHAFARLYTQTVPDTWQIINNEDVVVRGGKFVALYKRGGHRVLINKLGDLVVRPSYVETAIRKVPGAASLRDHLLTSYQVALSSVLGVQFSAKRFEKGREGVLRLAQQRGGRIVLETAGLAHDAWDVLQEHGWDALLEVRRRTKQTRTLLRPPPWAARFKAPASDGDALKADAGGAAAVVEEGKAGDEAAIAVALEKPSSPMQLQRSSGIGQLLRQVSRIGSMPRGQLPVDVEQLTSRGPVVAGGATPLDLLVRDEPGNQPNDDGVDS